MATFRLVIAVCKYTRRETFFVLAEVKTATFNELVCVQISEGRPNEKESFTTQTICEIKLPGITLLAQSLSQAQEAERRLSLPAVKTFCVLSQNSVLGLVGDVLPAANR